MTSKLALGTAQFGLAYGINNVRGQVPSGEVAQILEVARAAGVGLLDSSSAYGTAEEVLGPLLARHPGAFDVVSKLARCPIDAVDAQIERTFGQLGMRRLYGYLCHHFDFYREHPEIGNTLRGLKEAGRVAKIGFSLYRPAELEELLEGGVAFDLVQVPFNALDRRFEPLFSECAARGIEVHVRSVFLQGLLLRAPENLPAHFQPLRARIAAVREAAFAAAITPAQLLLAWVCNHPGISRVVIGVDSVAELEANIPSPAITGRARPHFTVLDGLGESAESLILPTHWPK